MRDIQEKVLQELEFHQVLAAVSGFCVTKSAAKRASGLRPLYNHKVLLAELKQVNEMLQVVSYDNLPAFSGTEIAAEIALLRIENSVVAEPGLMNINEVARSVNNLIAFFTKKKNAYPHLCQRIHKVEADPSVSAAIERVLDRHGKVKSSASALLGRIRDELGKRQSEAQQSFAAEVARLRRDGWLAETSESYVGGRRVLSVLSEYKRRVQGHVMGISSSGKLTYIEPASTIQINNEIVILENEELLEIQRILLELADFLRTRLHVIEAYQETVVIFDLLRAKARYAA